MNVYIWLGVILFLISFLSRRKEKSAKTSFFVSFFTIFVFAAIRYEFGPDYFSYREIFDQIKAVGLQQHLNNNEHTEVLFLSFLNLFNSYFVFIIVQSFVFSTVLYAFYKNYVSPKYLYVIVLMMFANTNFYLLHFVAIRSSFATCLFFIGLMCLTSEVKHSNNSPQKLKNQNLILYLLFVFVGTMIHSSSALFLIFPFISNNERYSDSKSKGVLSILVILAIITVPLQSTITIALSGWLMNLFPDWFGKYDYYLNFINRSSGGLGVLMFNMMKVAMAYPIILALTKESDAKYIRIMKMAVIFLVVFIAINEDLLGRYSMCFYPVILIALLRSYIYSNDTLRFISVFSFLFLSVFHFYTVYHMVSFESFLQYQTIFSAPYWQ